VPPQHFLPGARAPARRRAENMAAPTFATDAARRFYEAAATEPPMVHLFVVRFVCQDELSTVGEKPAERGQLRVSAQALTRL